MQHSKEKKTHEVWLRGPIEGIPALLQPVAHALLQASEDVHKYTTDLPENLLWKKPVGRASIGFHIQHMAGVIDRMMTYSKALPLSDLQFDYLKKEGVTDHNLSIAFLIHELDKKISGTLDYFKTLSDAELKEKRTVGRKELPSTVIGLLFHAAEHAQRHVGQLLVTASVLKSEKE